MLAPHAEIIELLCTIPGVQAQAAQVLIAECGLDMTLFPTVGHFASWAGACPGHHESAGRRRSGRTRPGPSWLTSQLTECARAAVRTKGTYLAAHYAQLRGRRGEPKAIGAIRHDLLVAYYHIVRDQVPYPRARTRLAAQALLSRAPRPPTPTPTRSARLRRHPRPSRTTRTRTSRLKQRQPAPGYRRPNNRRQRPLPKRDLNTGIHRSASRALRDSSGRCQDARVPTDAGLPNRNRSVTWRFTRGAGREGIRQRRRLRW